MSTIQEVNRAAYMVERAHIVNNCIFAYYHTHPIRTKRQKPNPNSFKRHQEMLVRIAPWLPRNIPRWMLPGY